MTRYESASLEYLSLLKKPLNMSGLLAMFEAEILRAFQNGYLAGENYQKDLSCGKPETQVSIDDNRRD